MSRMLEIALAGAPGKLNRAGLHRHRCGAVLIMSPRGNPVDLARPAVGNAVDFIFAVDCADHAVFASAAAERASDWSEQEPNRHPITDMV
jgi:hypothetical protein